MKTIHVFSLESGVSLVVQIKIINECMKKNIVLSSFGSSIHNQMHTPKIEQTENKLIKNYINADAHKRLFTIRL